MEISNPISYYRVTFRGHSLNLNKRIVEYTAVASMTFGVTYATMQYGPIHSNSTKALCDYTISMVVNSSKTIYDLLKLIFPVQLIEIGIVLLANVTILQLFNKLLKLTSNVNILNISILTSYLSIFYYFESFIKNLLETFLTQFILSIVFNSIKFSQISCSIIIGILFIDFFSKKLESYIDKPVILIHNMEQKFNLLAYFLLDFFLKSPRLACSNFIKDFKKMNLNLYFEVVSSILGALISYNYINFTYTITNALRTLLIGWLSYNAIYSQVTFGIATGELISKLDQSKKDPDSCRRLLVSLMISMVLPITIFGFTIIPVFFSFLIQLA